MASSALRSTQVDQGLAPRAAAPHGLDSDHVLSSGATNFLQSVLLDVRARDPEQVEFLDAVAEVAASLEPVFAKKPELLPAFRQLCEPERQITFRVAWLDDGNQIRARSGRLSPALCSASRYLRCC